MIVLLTFLFLFRDSLFLTLVKWQLETFAKRNLHTPLRYDRIEIRDGNIIVNNAKLEYLKNDFPHKFTADIERIIIGYAINPFKWDVHTDIELDHPKLSFIKKENMPLSIENLPINDAFFSRFLSKLSLNEGLLELCDLSEKQTEAQIFKIYFDKKERGGTTISLQLREKSKPENANGITLTLCKNEGCVNTNVSLLDLKCKDLLSALKILFPDRLSKWSISEGVLSGKIEVKTHEEHSPHFEGKLSLKSLSFENGVSDLKGRIDQISLNLEKRKNDHFSFKKTSPKQTLKNLLLATQGELKIQGDTFIEQCLEEKTDWKLKDISGTLNFQESNPLSFVVQGLLNQGKRFSPILLEGVSSSEENGEKTLNVTLDILSSVSSNASIAVENLPLSNGKQTTKVEIKNFSQNESNALFHFILPFFPEFNCFEISRGIINSSFEISFFHLRPQRLSLKKFSGNRLSLSSHFSKMQFDIPRFEGSAVIDLSSSRPLGTLEGNFSINDGNIYSLEEENKQWNFSNLEADLFFTKGMLHNSSIKTSLGNLSGDIFLDWFSPNNLMTCRFTGDAAAVGDFLPEKFSKGILSSFPKDKIAIDTNVKRKLGGLFLKGTAHIEDPKRHAQLIDFGFDIEKATQELWGKRPDKTNDTKEWIFFSHEALKTFVPTLSSSGSPFFTNWINEEIGCKGLVIRNGYLKTSHLPLEKYLHPFIFPNQEIKLSGHAEVEGTFNNSTVTLSYSTDLISLENEKLKMTFNDPPSSTENPTRRLKAFHYFDIRNNAHFGELPIKNGTYLDKTSHTYFTNITANAYLSKDHIRIENVCAKSSKLNFTAQINIDYADADAIGVSIKTSDISGKNSDLQNFLKRFTKSSLCNLPLEGKISSLAQQSSFHFLIKPKDLIFTSEIKGRLSEGSYTFENSGISLEDLSIDFIYCHENSSLEIPNLTGVWITNNNNSAETLNIHCRRAQIIDFSNPELQFDISLGNKNHDFIRLVGQASSEKREPEIISFSFDKSLCHIGNIIPNVSQLQLKNWKEILSFEAEPIINLNSFFNDAKCILSTSLLPLDNEQFAPYKHYKIYGEVEGKIAYDPDEKSYKFNAVGEDLVINQKRIEHLFLSGMKKENNWSIHQFQIDKISLTADLERTANDWNLHFLRLRYGKSIVIGMEGKYLEKEGDLQGKINFFEANLERIPETFPFHSIANAWAPQGSMLAQGKFKIRLPQKEDGDSLIEANMTSSFQNLKLQNLRFHDISNVRCSYSTKEGLRIEELAIKANDIRSQKETTLKMETLHYSPRRETCSLRNLHFSLDPEFLTTLSEMSQDLLPDYTRECSQLSEILQKIQSEKTLKGIANANVAPEKIHLSLSLENGKYAFANAEYILKDLSLNKTTHELKIESRCLHNNAEYWASCKTDSKEMKEGTFTLSEKRPNELKETDAPLTMLWKRGEKNDFFITKAEGDFSGLRFLLRHKKNALSTKQTVLTGKVAIDFKKAANLFDENIKNHIHSAQIGDGYELLGEFSLPSQSPEKINFEGQIKGKNFGLINKRFQTLSAKISCDHNSIYLQDLHVKDPAFEMLSDELTLVKYPHNKWLMNIPSIEIKNLHPKMLRAKKNNRSSSKPLIIKHAELRNVSGILSDPKTYSGKGYISFHNPSRKNLFHILFAIPNDLISRIGLDPNLLVPIMGTIDYELKGNKVYLTKFKDVYSDGRRSKFFLSRNSGQSYMDLYGNLNVKIKMKQHNIIFKIAELFTISIKGTIEKPLYTLQKDIAKTKPEETPVDNFKETNAAATDSGEITQKNENAHKRDVGNPILETK